MAATRGFRVDLTEQSNGDKRIFSFVPGWKTITAVVVCIGSLFTTAYAVKTRYVSTPKMKAQIIVNTKSLRLIRTQQASQKFMMSELIRKQFPGAEGERILMQAQCLEDQVAEDVDKEPIQLDDGLYGSLSK
jgi:hypothetical protein